MCGVLRGAEELQSILQLDVSTTLLWVSQTECLHYLSPLDTLAIPIMAPYNMIAFDHFEFQAHITR